MASGVAPVINSVEFLLKNPFERLKLEEKLAIKQQDKGIYGPRVWVMWSLYIYLYIYINIYTQSNSYVQM